MKNKPLENQGQPQAENTAAVEAESARQMLQIITDLVKGNLEDAALSQLLINSAVEVEGVELQEEIPLLPGESQEQLAFRYLYTHGFEEIMKTVPVYDARNIGKSEDPALRKMRRIKALFKGINWIVTIGDTLPTANLEASDPGKVLATVLPEGHTMTKKYPSYVTPMHDPRISSTLLICKPVPVSHLWAGLELVSGLEVANTRSLFQNKKLTEDQRITLSADRIKIIAIALNHISRGTFEKAVIPLLRKNHIRKLTDITDSNPGIVRIYKELDGRFFREGGYSEFEISVRYSFYRMILTYALAREIGAQTGHDGEELFRLGLKNSYTF